MYGVVGTFTNDATATAGDIASGKTAYVRGQKITGNLNGTSFDKILIISYASRPSYNAINIISGDDTLISTRFISDSPASTMVSFKRTGRLYVVKKYGDKVNSGTAPELTINEKIIQENNYIDIRSGSAILGNSSTTTSLFIQTFLFSIVI